MSAQNELQKEFELERMILFSDAVFAIAITLLIIEIKFPEIHKGATSEEIWHEFKPTIIRFFGFILSFFFIGIMWARHLKICKYLRSYNNGVIFRNLVFLFFIVCFPFTASGFTENIRPGFLLPIFFYIINVAAVAVSHYALCLYIFKTRKQLSVNGYELEKKYILLQSKYSAVIFIVTVVFLISLSIIFKDHPSYVLFGFYILPIMMGIMRRAIKKHKPIEQDAQLA